MAAYTTVDDAGSFFKTLLYVGNDGTGHAITGTGFQPDFTWIKNRTASDFHNLYDSTRGVTKYLQSNDSALEVTDAESLQSFDTDGFTVGNIAQINTSPEDYVSWNWKMGTTSGLTGGTITPASYSFNATSGVGIYKYTGTGAAGTITHGLGAVPKFMINKKYIGGVQEWKVYHEAMGNTKFMVLDQTDNEGTNTNIWNDTTPTSTVFTIGSEISATAASDKYVQYVFTNVQGFSRFGSYPGNGDADGPYIYTGFRPAYTMIKQISGSGSNGWYILDDKRVGFNPDNENLIANSTGYEDDTNNYWDLLSNGFKIRTTGGNVNTNGSQYLYMAFASNPFVNSSGVPGNAR